MKRFLQAILYGSLLFSFSTSVSADHQEDKARVGRTQKRGQVQNREKKEVDKQEEAQKERAEGEGAQRERGEERRGRKEAGQGKDNPRALAAKMTADFRQHHVRLARMDRLTEIFTKKGDKEKLARVETLRAEQMKRFDGRMEHYRQAMGEKDFEQAKARLATRRHSGEGRDKGHDEDAKHRGEDHDGGDAKQHGDDPQHRDDDAKHRGDEKIKDQKGRARGAQQGARREGEGTRRGQD